MKRASVILCSADGVLKCLHFALAFVITQQNDASTCTSEGIVLD